MFKQSLRTAILATLTLTVLTPAFAEDTVKDCRLKGGSMVVLAAPACAMEGGTPIVTYVVPTLQLSNDPQLAVAQRSVLEILNKPVVEKTVQKNDPENISRSANFDGCNLQVDELVHVDHGNAYTSRRHFKIHSSINLKTVEADAISDLGEVDSLGGGLKAYGIALTKRIRDEHSAFSISVLEQTIDKEKPFTMPGPIAYFGTLRDDMWVADEYGYPRGNGASDYYTDKVRLMYLVNTSEEASKLKQALEAARALCQK